MPVSRASTRFAILSVLVLVPTAAGIAASQSTECFSIFPPGLGNQPKWVAAGFSRVNVVNNGTMIWTDHFFDGGGGWVPNRLNFVAGATDCDQNPDARAVWGYTATDDNTQLGAFITLNVTAFRATVAQQPQTCTHTSNPQVMFYSMDTRDDASILRSESGSLPFKFDLSNCVAGQFSHIRLLAITDMSVRTKAEGHLDTLFAGRGAA
jgi:hypothetical protein